MNAGHITILYCSTETIAFLEHNHRETYSEVHIAHHSVVLLTIYLKLSSILNSLCLQGVHIKLLLLSSFLSAGGVLEPSLRPTLGEFLYTRRFSLPGTYIGVWERGGRLTGDISALANFRSTSGVPFRGVRLIECNSC